MGLRPGLPEHLVVCMGVKEESQFPHVINDPVAEKEVAQDMKGEISEVVNGV
jgi:hypothetical protein